MTISPVIAEPSFWLLLAFILFSFVTQTTIGFGGVVIALTLGAHLYTIQELLIWLPPLSIALSAYLLLRYHGDIDWGLLLKRIAPFLVLGMVVGQALFYSLGSGQLKLIFGVAVTFLGVRELWLLFHQGHDAPKNRPLSLWSGLAGITQGLFASAGPVLVYGLAAQGIPKGVFRSTLAACWIAFNLPLMLSYYLAGNLTGQSVSEILVCLAVLVPAVMIGEWLHHNVNERRFAIAVYATLVFSGLALVFS